MKKRKFIVHKHNASAVTLIDVQTGRPYMTFTGSFARKFFQWLAKEGRRQNASDPSPQNKTSKK